MADLQSGLRIPVEILRPSTSYTMPGVLFEGDENANRITLALMQNGESADIGTVSVSGEVERADGNRVPCKGEQNGNELSIILNANCYNVPGACKIFVIAKSEGVERTLAEINAYVRGRKNGAIVEVETVIPSIEDILQRIDELEAAGIATVEAIEAKGQEVRESLPDDYTALAGEVSQLSDGMGGLNNAVQIPVLQDLTFDDGFYRYNGTIPPQLDNTTLPGFFKAALFDVSEGERYTVKLHAFGTGVATYFVFSDNSNILQGPSGTTAPTLVEYDVTIPDGGLTMVINGHADYPIEVYKYAAGSLEYVLTKIEEIPKGVFYSVENDTITLKSHTRNGEAVYEFGKRGSNNLPDFRSVIIGGDQIVRNQTDWHSPFIIGAIDNIDGVHPDKDTYYTGGNHDINNTASSYSAATATARCAYLEYLADGKETTEGESGYANNVTIRWENFVQGYNTSKADGSGREILKETHIMTFDGHRFESHVDLVPLEAVFVKAYYGFQMKVDNVFINKMRFVGADNRAECTNLTAVTYTSQNNSPNAIIAYGDLHKMTLEIDRTYDMGRNTFYSGNEGAFTTTNPKLYFNLVENTEMKSGDMFSARACWTFE